MLRWEHSAILSTFIKLPYVIKVFVSSNFEWSFYTGFTVLTHYHLVLFNNFGKQFGPRSGPTKCRAILLGLIRIQTLDTQMVFLEEFFKTVDFEKNQQTKKSLKNFPEAELRNSLLFAEKESLSRS